MRRHDIALWIATVVATVGTIGCSTQAPEVPIPACLQDSDRTPLPIELLEYLPTIARNDAIESADALIDDGTVALSRRPPHELPLEPTWREDPYGDPSWVYEYQSLFFVIDALLAYEATGENKYLDSVQRHLDRWLAVHLQPDFRAAWGDHVMANRTRILLWAWERLRERDAASETVDGLCRHLAVHGSHLANEEEYTANHNHGFFQDEALLSLAVAFEDHPLQGEWLALARERLAGQIEYAATEEGVHREHSPSYHSGMQQRFANLAGLLDDLEIVLRVDISLVVTRMYAFAAYGVLPTGRAPLVGDSSSWFGSANRPTITNDALYSLSRGQQGVTPETVDRVFFESGYAFFRDAWHPAETFDQMVYVGFIAGLFSRAHKHCDDLSVLLHGYGESWLTDMGLWSYDKDDLYQVLALSPAGHNVVEVDHKSYFESYPEARSIESGQKLLTDFELGVSVSVVKGEHRLNPGVLFRRELAYTRPGGLVVSDELVAEDGNTHDYVLYWHIAADKTVAATSASSFLVTTADANGPTMTIDVTGSSLISCELIIGATDPYQGWHFPAFLEFEEAPVVACSQRAEGASFTTVMALDPGAGS